ncbi:response regulator [Pseudodonghicola xiamenensis]|uniref:Uncharacterized protein n=1 Tax=Pseudodonghicola xiamenensis TaxID=337702 RepID=A0A8J3H9J6_9RHOB|nr:hypothetical protein [Pseudodonghicola xiamenensis]GHG93839.1 hypothetical protein GCM10010961_26580 [Pseudodonghicola xiamenensis]
MSMQKGMFPDAGLSGVEPAAHDHDTKASTGWMKQLGLMGLSSEMFTLRSNKLCPKGLSVYLGPSDSTSVGYRDWVSQFGGNLMVVSEEEPPVEWLLKYADKLDFLLLDSDYVGDVEDVVDLCLYLRRAAPGLKIVLISSQVRNDDFTAERMMACDATLKAPFDRSRLQEAFEAAQENSAYYNRVRQMTQLSPRISPSGA